MADRTKQGDGARGNMDVQFTLIRELKPGMKNLRLVFIVLEIGRPNLTKENHEVRSVKVADRSGCINISLWDEPGQLLLVGPRELREGVKFGTQHFLALSAKKFCYKIF
ncbi:SOSS complex subunit B [Chionoecetes opilio]|uniref:SOSS complex subunit B n=1 Tax=Chionoecetes opilio TaxID=41210 RepID=A0A8J4YJT7_CHIOP|nr:SOSS complex subunit B [Chionoecetes opilio]